MKNNVKSDFPAVFLPIPCSAAFCIISALIGAKIAFACEDTDKASDIAVCITVFCCFAFNFILSAKLSKSQSPACPLISCAILLFVFVFISAFSKSEFTSFSVFLYICAAVSSLLCLLFFKKYKSKSAIRKIRKIRR